MAEQLKMHCDEMADFPGQEKADIETALQTFDEIASQIRQRIEAGERICINTQTGFAIFERVDTTPPGERPFCFVRTRNDVFAFTFPEERIEAPKEEDAGLPS